MYFLLLSALALAGGEPEVFHGRLAPGGSTVQLVKVLAVSADGSALAWKIVATDNNGEQAPHDCGYAGMEKMPLSAVTLGVWDLKSDAASEHWEIYGPATRPEDCTPHEESEKQLAAAKARFAALGLDIASSPAPLVVDDEGTLEWTSAGASHSITIATVPRYSPATAADQAADAMLGMTFITGLRVKHGDTVLHTRLGEYTTMMAGGLSMSAPLAFPAGDGVVLLERWDHSSMRGGTSSFSFSPVLSVP